MSSKNDIIEELYRSKDFNDCIGKMEPEHLRDDLRAEVILILLETEEDKILALHDQGTIKFYAARIIINLIQSKTSRFYYQYRRNFSEVMDIKVTDDIAPLHSVECLKHDFIGEMEETAIQSKLNGPTKEQVNNHDIITPPMELPSGSILKDEVQILIRQRIKSINTRMKTAEKRLHASDQLFEELRGAFNDEIDFYRSMIILIDNKGEHIPRAKIINNISQLNLEFDDLVKAENDFEYLRSNIDAAHNELYWYDKEILKMYFELGNYRAVAKETGIPFPSIYKTVQKAIKQIRQKVVA